MPPEKDTKPIDHSRTDKAVYCGRPTVFGNPFDNVADFRQWLTEFRERNVLAYPRRFRGDELDIRAARLLG